MERARLIRQGLNAVAAKKQRPETSRSPAFHFDDPRDSEVVKFRRLRAEGGSRGWWARWRRSCRRCRGGCWKSSSAKLVRPEVLGRLNLAACAARFLRVRPFQAVARAEFGRSPAALRRLCARACHSSAARTFVVPRTSSRVRPRLRTCAFTHSTVAARHL